MGRADRPDDWLNENYPGDSLLHRSGIRRIRLRRPLHNRPQLTIDAQDTALVCGLAKEDPRLALRQLLCLACVDYQDYLQLVYFLHSLDTDHTLVLKTSVPTENPRVPSISGIWRAGEWYEREAHDLFGVEFDGHPGLAHLLLYEGFEGFPGRRDFPFNDYQEY